MFRLINQVFNALLTLTGSLASIVLASDHEKCISLNNEQYMAQPTLINLCHMLLSICS